MIKKLRQDYIDKLTRSASTLHSLKIRDLNYTIYFDQIKSDPMEKGANKDTEEVISEHAILYFSKRQKRQEKGEEHNKRALADFFI